MEVGLVGAAYEVGHVGHGTVGDHLDRLLQVQGAQVTRLATEVVFNLGNGGKAEPALEPLDLARLDLVEVVITSHQQQPHGALVDHAVFTRFVGGQHQALDGLLQGQAQELRHVGTGALARCWGLDQGLSGRCTRGQQGHRFGQLDVGREVAGGAVDDGVFTRVGDDLKLVREIATDGAGVGRHGAVLQAKAVEDALVGGEHGLVAARSGSGVAVEGVGVLHGELTAAHDAKARTALVAELGLDLVEVLGQLLVAAELLARDVGHHLFTGGLDDKGAPVAVLDAQQLGAHLVESTGLLPQLGRLHHRHRDLNSPSSVHLFADDGLHLADDAQPHGHVVVDARAQALDQARAHHQLVADDFSVCGRFLEGADEELAGFHVRMGAQGLASMGSTHRAGAIINPT